VEATGNLEMARIHHDLTERLRIVSRIDFTKRFRVEATYEEHAKILRTIMERRSEDAQLLLKTHIEASKAEARRITLHMLDEDQQQVPDVLGAVKDEVGRISQRRNPTTLPDPTSKSFSFVR